jgi:lysozyme
MNIDNPTTVTDNCTRLIKTDESLKNYPYLCPSNVLSVGWGHKILPKFDCKVWNVGADLVAQIVAECQNKRIVTLEARTVLRVTRDQAVAFFNRDVSQAALFVRSLVSVKLTQNQFDALVSLSFNIGQGNFATSSLRDLLNEGDYAGAAAQFDVWNKGTVNGRKVVLPGLVTRRAAERALFETIS